MDAMAEEPQAISVWHHLLLFERLGYEHVVEVIDARHEEWLVRVSPVLT